MTQKKDDATRELNLPKDVKQTLAEVDWDLLDQMDLEEEGQAVPVQNSPNAPKASQDNSRLGLRVDPPNGLLKHVPKR